MNLLLLYRIKCLPKNTNGRLAIPALAGLLVIILSLLQTIYSSYVLYSKNFSYMNCYQLNETIQCGLYLVQEFSKKICVCDAWSSKYLQCECCYVMLIQVVVSTRSHGYLASPMMRVMMMMVMTTAVRITVVDTGRKIIGSRQITHHQDRMMLVKHPVHPVILVPVNDKDL